MAAVLVLTVLAQGRARAQVQSGAERVLIERARSLETHGKGDLAAQSWRQVLLSDPRNQEALTALARYARQSGNPAEAQGYLDRLRQVNPANPDLSRIAAMPAIAAQNARLAEAGRLAKAGQYEQAMKIYRDAYGEHPPEGEIALGYYETEAATAEGRTHALAGLRALARRNPAEGRYAVALGRVLTYNPETRAEGDRILRRHPSDPDAQAALRQSLLWDSENPASAPGIREYLKQHPDTELSTRLARMEARQAQQPAGLAATAEERAAYSALDANRANEAQERFEEILRKQPENARALAGMGFVRMKQNDFAAAIRCLEQSQQHGLRGAVVANALETARFWQTMAEGAAALQQNHLEVATASFQAALARKPARPEALQGLAGTLRRQGQAAAAEGVYRQLVQLQPGSADAWRGLVVSQIEADRPQQALATVESLPAKVRSALSLDPEYLRLLASAYTAVGEEKQAAAVLAQGLGLPFPKGGLGLPPERQMEYAALLAQGGRFAQAAGLYRQAAANDPGNIAAWQGLVRVQHQGGQDAEALASSRSMPADVLNAALRDPGFLATLASVYQQQGELEEAQSYLERAARLLSPAPLSIPLQLQLASIHLARKQPDEAYAIYRMVRERSPERADAWKGILGALHQGGRDREALRQLSQIPAPVRMQLTEDVQFVQTAAAIYSAAGDTRLALVAMRQVEALYRRGDALPPADVEIQASWLFFNAKDDPALYPTLMRMGGREDLTDGQRREVQTIWASWSARRADEAMDAGHSGRALEILNAAALAFPGNPAVSRALAAGYLRAGKARQALEIYKTLDLTGASSAEYQAAVGAALAAQDKARAEIWLRQALQAYSRDAGILALAARYEQARGEPAKAAQYWRAALAAMPAETPADKLARTLAQGEVSPGGKPDLATLLDPDRAGGAAHLSSPLRLPGEAVNAVASSLAPDADTGLFPSKAASGDPPGKKQERLFPEDISDSASRSRPIASLGDYSPQPAPTDPGPDAMLAVDGPAAEQASILKHQIAAIRSEPEASPGLLSGADSRASGHGVASQGVTDEELMQQELPPLRGSLSGRAVARKPADARQQAEQELAAIEGGYSPWMGGSSVVTHRSGAPGVDRMTALEAPFEASAALGASLRATVIARPVLLDAGSTDGPSTQRLGSLAEGAVIGQQNASGIGGELQLAAANFGASVGYSPYGFLVSNVIGRATLRPAAGPVTLSFVRDSLKDTQLSYAGLRDPGSVSAIYTGNVWGGVVSNAGNLQYSRGDAASGYYVGVGGQYLTGQHVVANRRYDGTAGAYWRALTYPDGNLTVGMNFFGMHYDHNQSGFTYGQGGYFSPDVYMLASVPFEWQGRYTPGFHYRVSGGVGGQAFQESSVPLFPLDPALQRANHYLRLPARSSVGGHYDLKSEGALRIADRWFVGGFLNFNNSRDYNSQTAGFFVRYLFRPQQQNDLGAAGLFPRDGIRPLLVP